jgi:hypothetical protein
VLHPGTQLIAGSVQLAADYVTRAVPAVGGTRVILLLDVLIPSGASVTPTLRLYQGGGVWGEYAAMTLEGVVPGDEGVLESRYSVENIDAEAVQVRLDLAGTVQARPLVSNIRVLVV